MIPPHPAILFRFLLALQFYSDCDFIHVQLINMSKEENETESKGKNRVQDGHVGLHSSTIRSGLEYNTTAKSKPSHSNQPASLPSAQPQPVLSSYVERVKSRDTITGLYAAAGLSS